MGLMHRRPGADYALREPTHRAHMSASPPSPCLLDFPTFEGGGGREGGLLSEKLTEQKEAYEEA